MLVDDHAMVRAGTAELLRRIPDFTVVAEASDGKSAVELAQRIKPDIVVMDVHMPGLSGVETTQRLRELLPGIHVLVLSAYDDDHYVFSLLRAGASGYILKTAPIEELVRAIHQVEAGDFPLDPKIIRKVVLNLPTRFSQSAEPLGGQHEPEELTEREERVLQLLAQGMSNREIADALFVSDRTVQAHLTRIFAKLGVSSRLEAVLTAVRRGWLTLTP
jgi:two-component system, NarL family, response regulator LiaR